MIQQTFEWMPIDWASMMFGASVLAGIALLVVRCLKSEAAAHRFAVLACALCAIVALPMISLATPKWTVPGSSATVAPALTDRAPETSVAPPLSNTTRAIVNSGADAVAPGTLPRPLNVSSWLLFAWLIGAIALVGRLFLAAARLRQLVRQSVPLDTWHDALHDAQQRLGLSRQVTLRLHPEPIMPMTFGVLSPVILLPVEADAWSHARRRDVLLHELAHIQRQDVLFEWVGQVACAMHWFNPLVWITRRQMIVERELACDDRVLTAGADPSGYAQALLQTSLDHRDRALPAPCMANGSELESRLRLIMDRQRQRGALSVPQLGAVAAAGLIVLFAVSALAFDERRVPKPPAPAAPEAPELAEVAPAAAAPPAAVAPPAPRAPAPPAAPPGGLRDEALFKRYTSDSQLFRDKAVLDSTPEDELTVYDLLNALRSESELNRAAAAKAMGDFRDPQVIPALVNALEDPSEHVREWAARSLGRVGDDTTLAPLAGALNDDEGEVAEWAARSLGDLGQMESTDALVQSLTHRNPAVREWSARSLGRIGGDRAVDGLIATLQDTDREVREWAVRALGNIGDPRALSAVTALANDPSADVREWSERTARDLQSAERAGKR